MVNCMAIQQNSKRCIYSAKYVLEEYNLYVCKMHALSQANARHDASYQFITDIPGLRVLKPLSVGSKETIDKAIAHMKDIHYLFLTDNDPKVLSTRKVRNGFELIISMKNYEYQMFIVCKGIEDAINVSSSYGYMYSKLKNAVCIPIVSYDQAIAGMTNRCFLRGWNRDEWYYEVKYMAYPLLELDNALSQKKFVTRVLELIKDIHDYHLVSGNVDINQLVQMRSKRLSSIVFNSMENLLQRVGIRGNVVEDGTSLDSSFRFDSTTCARTLNQKKFPCRYDDFESLLYTIMLLVHGTLPWIELSSDKDIAPQKTIFLKDLATDIESPSGRIANLILECHYDDRPNYALIEAAFEELI